MGHRGHSSGVRPSSSGWYEYAWSFDRIATKRERRANSAIALREAPTEKCRGHKVFELLPFLSMLFSRCCNFWAVFCFVWHEKQCIVSINPLRLERTRPCFDSAVAFEPTSPAGMPPVLPVAMVTYVTRWKQRWHW